MNSKLRHRLRHAAFARKHRNTLETICRQIVDALGMESLSVRLDPREPHSPRALCFFVLHEGVPCYFGKQVAIETQPEYLDFGGVRMFNGWAFIDKTIEMADRLAPDGLAPKVRRVGDDILLFDYIFHPTFLSLANSVANVEALLRMSVKGLRALHAEGLVHLDPNWGNMFLVDPERMPVFIDFDREIGPQPGPVPEEAIDYFNLYTGLFVTKPLEFVCRENAPRLAEVFWNSLAESERDAIARIGQQHLRIQFPKLARKPALMYGLRALQGMAEGRLSWCPPR